MLRVGLKVFFCSVISFGLAFAQSAGETQKNNDAAAAKAANQDVMAKQVESLLAMPAKERRARLKSMDRDKRKGLWFQLKKEQNAREGLSKRRSYGTPFPIDVEPTEWASRGTTGTITYDSGFPTLGFGNGALVGNRFNTHTAVPVLASGTVNTVQALVVPGPANTTNSAGFVLHGPQTVGGGAMAIFSTFTTVTGVIASASWTGINANYTGSSFFVLFGDFASVYIPVFGPETTLGQGHHGLAGLTGGMGPNITATTPIGTGNLNAFIRAGGNIVPVELMKFSVE